MSQRSMLNNSEVKLSVVVTIVGGGVYLEKCLSRLEAQGQGKPVEIIVPYDDQVTGIPTLKTNFPDVKFVGMGLLATQAPAGSQSGLHELYDRRISGGLAAACGEIIAILQDYCQPAADWCDQLIAAHSLPYGAIGGAVEHKGKGLLNWAVYFLDFGRYQLPLLEGPAENLTDVNISYKRAALEPLRDRWIERYEEVVVNHWLRQRGETFWQRPQIVVFQDRGRLALSGLLTERFAWGRLLGSLRVKSMSPASRLIHSLASPVLPILLIGRIAGKVFAGKRNRLDFILSLPFTALLALTWSVGELTGYLTGVEA